MDLIQPLDGFWLPKSIREQVLSSESEYESQSFAKGRPCEPGDDGAVTARWPTLSHENWLGLLAALHENRLRAPKGRDYWARLQSALEIVSRRFIEPTNPLRTRALTALPGYTGYSEGMIGFTLGALDLMALDQMPSAFSMAPTHRAAAGWQPVPGLPGRLRFHETNPYSRILKRILGRSDRPIFGPLSVPEMVLGYGAGNVPGTALLIAFLAQAATLAGGPPPVVVVKNSRREPIFSPLVLSGLEQVDPDLVSSVAVLIWDYNEGALQDLPLTQADLVIAAASDETIAQIESQIEAVKEKQTRKSSQAIRFHAHGHKFSFSAIGRETLLRDMVDETSGQPVIDVIALLAALDSVFWDQFGCLSSRVHFVETGDGGHHTPLEYAERLDAQLRRLAAFLPRGSWPLQQIHDSFDRYKLLETTGLVQVISKYEDEFLVAVDQRPLNETAFRSVVNDCTGRVIIIRPVADLLEIPDRYLRQLPPANLQSLSVAVGRRGEGLSDRLLRFFEGCGDRGITAIRTVGRGAFPQLAYSWDGLIPLDLVRGRPSGHFTTLEFDHPFEQMLETYQLLLRRGSALGATGS